MTGQKPDLGTGSVAKLIFKLSLPAIAAQIINLLYNLIDRMYIGHIEEIGKLALTGVGVCLPILMIISAFAALVSMGGAPRAAIFLGKNDRESAEKILGNCVMLLIVISVFLTVILEIFAEDLLYIFGASENTIEYALSYLRIYIAGTVFVQLTLGLNAFISTQGFTKISMISVIIGAVTNIILDPVLIFGLKLGVRGAAVATIISQCISMLWALSFLCGKKTVLRLQPRHLRLKPRILLPCLALGLASFVMQATESLIALCFNSSLLKYGGDLAVGAMTIMTSVMQLSMMPLFGLAQGAQPVMGYNFGARNPDRVKQSFKILLISAFSYSAVFWLSIQLFPQVFVLIFNNNAQLVEFTARNLRIFMGTTGLFGIQIACQQSFVALGNSKSALAAALVRKVIVLIPLIYLLPALGVFSENTTAVFVAEPIADFIAVVFTATLFSIQFGKALKKMKSNHSL